MYYLFYKYINILTGRNLQCGYVCIVGDPDDTV